MPTKEDVVEKVSINTGSPKYRCAEWVDHVFTGVMDTLADLKDLPPDPKKKNARGRLTIVGLGVYELRHVEERLYRNPQDRSQETPKDAHNKVVFRPGKTLEEIINS